jgi:hypothetical protein
MQIICSNQHKLSAFAGSGSGLSVPLGDAQIIQVLAIDSDSRYDIISKSLLSGKNKMKEFARLLRIMKKLCHPRRGCPWDLAQSPQILVP